MLARGASPSDLWFPGDAPPPPPRWLVDRLIPLAAVTLLFGEPATGKSIVATDLGRAVASGGLWIGNEVAAGSALILAPERGGLTRFRLTSWCSKGSPIAVCSRQVNLRDKNAAADIIDKVQAVAERTGRPVELIILDTLSVAMPGSDENSVRDINEAFATLHRIATETEAAVVVVHNTAKAGDEIRGSSAILAAVDAAVRIRRDREGSFVEGIKSNASAVSKARLRFKIESAEHNADTPIVVSNNEPGSQRQANRPVVRGDAKRILAALEDLAEPTSLEAWRSAAFAALGDRTGAAKRQAFSDARKTLSNAGLIVIDGETVSVSDRQKASALEAT